MSALVKEALSKAYAETAHIEDKQDYANPTEILMSKITNADIAEVQRVGKSLVFVSVVADYIFGLH